MTDRGRVERHTTDRRREAGHLSDWGREAGHMTDWGRERHTRASLTCEVCRRPTNSSIC